MPDALLGAACRVPSATVLRNSTNSIVVELVHKRSVLYVFGLDADNKDSHVLRTANNDLGPAPNIKNVGDGGYGYMIDILGQYNYSTQLKFDFGYRWWLFDTDSGNTKFGPNFTTAFPNRSLKSERSGLLIGANYSF